MSFSNIILLKILLRYITFEKCLYFCKNHVLGLCEILWISWNGRKHFATKWDILQNWFEEARFYLQKSYQNLIWAKWFNCRQYFQIHAWGMLCTGTQFSMICHYGYNWWLGYSTGESQTSPWRPWINRKTHFHCFHFCCCIFIYISFNIVSCNNNLPYYTCLSFTSQIVFLLLQSTHVLSFSINIISTLSISTCELRLANYTLMKGSVVCCRGVVLIYLPANGVILKFKFFVWMYQNKNMT